MPRFEPDRPDILSAELTPDEREWIRRQGVSARLLAEERREVGESIAEAARRLRIEALRHGLNQRLDE